MSSARFKNYYQILELEAFSDAEAVKAAFRRLARQYHPDLNAGNDTAEDKFKEINEAYDVLSDTGKRSLYDESLRVLLYKQQPASDGKKQAQGKPRTESKPPPSAKAKTSKTGKEPDSNTPISEMFETFLKKGFKPEDGKDGASFTDGAFARSGGKAKRGEDVVVPTAITPQEAEAGVIKTVNVQHNDLCRRCTGTGKVSGAVCPVCHGEKIQVRIKKIDVRIPAGVKQGSRVRVAKEGGRGVNSGDPGDLFLQIQISYDPSLRVEGLDVHGEVMISVVEAVLGGEIEVPTLNGTVKMTVPSLTSSGKVFRLKERGVQNAQARGDHYVTVRIVAPETLTPREKELYEELARLRR